MKPRKAWLQSFDYEIDSDVVSANIEAFLNEKIDAEAKIFGKYEEAKSRITINIKIDSKEKKRKRIIEDLEEKLDTLGKDKEPLHITQGLGEDEEKESGDEEEEEGDKGKSQIVIMSPRKKPQQTKKKLGVTSLSPPLNKPRTRVATSVE